MPLQQKQHTLMRLGKLKRLPLQIFIFLKEDGPVPSLGKALELHQERKHYYRRDMTAYLLAAKKAVNAASEQQSFQIYSHHGQLAGSTEETRKAEHAHRHHPCVWGSC